MAGLTTHVLDQASGLPAAGVAVRLSWRGESEVHRLAEQITDIDGRARLLEPADLIAGRYRLEFDIGAHFGGVGSGSGFGPSFLDVVVIDFGVGEVERHYHVPLLVSPFGYTTYRGS